MPHFDLSSPRVEERNGVRCLSTNTDCLFNKVNEIELFLNVNDIDIASFTETMPKNCNNVDLRNVQINLKVMHVYPILLAEEYAYILRMNMKFLKD